MPALKETGTEHLIKHVKKMMDDQEFPFRDSEIQKLYQGFLGANPIQHSRQRNEESKALSEK